MTRRSSVPAPGCPVDSLPLLVDGPAGADAGWRLVLAPGAGAPMTSDFMAGLAAGLACHGVQVIRFDFPYRVRGRKAPDRPPVLEAAWRAVLAGLLDDAARTAIGGKSMGGRIATHMLADPSGFSGVDACVLYGYPLHAPGRPERTRDAHLSDVDVPMLFFSGDRDRLARVDLLRASLRRLSSADLVVINDADHDFAVPKRTGRSREDVIAELAVRTAKWLVEQESSTGSAL
jgi:predicted alpha/beta-hydrolase family hydrolase